SVLRFLLEAERHLFSRDVGSPELEVIGLVLDDELNREQHPQRHVSQAPRWPRRLRRGDCPRQAEEHDDGESCPIDRVIEASAVVPGQGGGGGTQKENEGDQLTTARWLPPQRPQ